MKGMNLRNQLFPELGYITSTRYQYGKNRQFEFKLDRGFQIEADRLFMAYGLDVRAIDVMLPFDEPAKNFRTYYSAKANGITIMGSDDKTISWLKDPISMLPLVSNSQAIIPIPEWNVRTGDAVPFRNLTKWGADIEVTTSKKAMLKVMLPDLHNLSYMSVILTNPDDIDSMEQHLTAIENASTGHLTNIPMQLKFNAVPFRMRHGKVYRENIVITANLDQPADNLDTDIYRMLLGEIYETGIVRERNAYA